MINYLLRYMIVIKHMQAYICLHLFTQKVLQTCFNLFLSRNLTPFKRWEVFGMMKILARHLWGAVLLFIPYLMTSKNEYRISINEFRISINVWIS